jgi:predicted 2-oxoglutarate/Fe(II)-dependent dioxygenase YbiX
MMLCIGEAFDKQEAAAIRSEVEDLNFVDGRATAGWAARLVKDNEQADADDNQLRRSEHASLSGSCKTKYFKWLCDLKCLRH